MMKTDILVYIVTGLLCVQHAQAEPPRSRQQPQPLVFRNWPPNRQSSGLRSSQLMAALRGAGTQNILSRVPPPGMFIKSPSPIRFAIPQRPHKNGIASSPSNNFFFKSAPQHYKRPYASPLTSQSMFKLSSPHKTAIKFQSPPPVPLKSKPEFIYEKVTVPKFSDPVRFNIGSDGAIHTIPAPNLGSKDAQAHSAAPEFTLNNQLDSDLTKIPAHGFAISKPVHQYQVKEHINDLTFKNPYTGQKTYYAPDNDPSLQTSGVRPIDDPLNVPSDGKPKPADVLYHQSLDFGASPLIQNHYQYQSSDPFGYGASAQPQLQQYHLQQNTMMKQGMPLASLNPTYLVMQSNNLLGQHQQHLQQLFRPENGYIDTSVTAQPHPAVATLSGVDYSSPEQAASLGQIYAAQQDQLHQQHHQHGFSSTQSPTTIEVYHHDGAASHESPAFTQVVDPQPSHYQYAQQNFIDLPEEHLTQNDIHNLIDYNDIYLYRQLENDQIIKEAQENLQQKLKVQQQQEQTAYDLHQLVQREKFHPLRIIVPDDDHSFKKRVDNEAISYEEDDPEDEDEDDQEGNESENESEESESEKPKAAQKDVKSS